MRHAGRVWRRSTEPIRRAGSLETLAWSRPACDDRLMPRSLVVALVVAVLVAGCGGAPASSDTRPDASRLHDLLERTLAQKARDLGVPGAAAAIVFPGGSTWAGGTGLAALAPRSAVTAATAFGYRSITKTFFAALTLRLAEQGRLRLDDGVRRWVPSWRGDPDATVRDLLRHTAGTRDLPDRAWSRILAHPGRAGAQRG
jgi:CubicO group peptidase (beta-lactamase class C family)